MAVELVSVREDPGATVVEVLFEDEAGLRYVVHAVGPSPESVVAVANEEAEGYLGSEAATDWNAV